VDEEKKIEEVGIQAEIESSRSIWSLRFLRIAIIGFSNSLMEPKPA